MFISKRSNGFYYLYFEGNNGKIKKVSCKTKVKVEALHFVREFDMNRQKVKLEKKSLKELMSDYLAYSKPLHTKKTNRGIQLAFTEFIRISGNIPVEQVDVKVIEKFLANKQTEASVWTARKYYLTLASAFEKAKTWKYIQENPFRNVKKPKPPELLPLYFSREEFKVFLNIIDDMDFKELVIFALLSGMRLAEITNLKWTDSDLNRKVIIIQNSDTFKTKSGKSRVVPMNEELFKMLSLKKNEADNEYVFAKNGLKYRDEYVSKTFKRLVRQAGINEKLHFHSLRHSFASWLVADGVSLFEVQRLLGHTNPMTTMIYSHLQPERMHNIVNRIAIK